MWYDGLKLKTVAPGTQLERYLHKGKFESATTHYFQRAQSERAVLNCFFCFLPYAHRQHQTKDDDKYCSTQVTISDAK